MIDHALAKLLQNNWRAPKPGETVAGLDGKPRTWKTILAGADGTFPREAYRRGWAHFEVVSKTPRIMLLIAPGTGAAYEDGRPQAADLHAYGWLQLPVRLRAGKTSFMFATGRGPFRAKLVQPPKRLFLNLGDSTLPDIRVNKGGRMTAGIIVTNANESFRRDLRVVAKIGNGRPVETKLDPVPPLILKKVPVSFEAPIVPEPGDLTMRIALFASGKQVDTKAVKLRVRGNLQTRKITFLSNVDGSVQYYAINPAQRPGEGKALVMGLHGARTEGIEMADDYKGKDWCHIVCPTNRRPFGFDWEDIGRLDMLEVLKLAKSELKTAPDRTYLTGHSMGGHGAWINGLMFPDHWAAVAPCAAWISVSSYWSRIAPASRAEEAMFLASNASETLLLKHNALNYPIYIHHGDKDEDVEYSESQKMNDELKKLKHPNVSFHTMPGAGHWFGTESIDWPGIFDLFHGQSLVSKAKKDSVDFSTMSPAISSKAWWLEILQQERHLDLSRARFSRSSDKLVGITENIAAIRFDREAFLAESESIEIDGQLVSIAAGLGPATLRKFNGRWRIASLPNEEKTPGRMGPFKEVFRKRFRFVYGTRGTKEETDQNLSLARFHAEEFLYGGNGAIDIVSDRGFLTEDESKTKTGNVVMFGNANSNAAWDRLLPKCPIRVERGSVKVGKQMHRGTDLACLFIWPRSGSDDALVGVAASTGRLGHGALERLPFFTSGAHFPDWTVVGAEMYEKGIKAVRSAGFFGNHWELPK
jgi:pimeloyl-ACP methyl ester carboxylesterase